MNGRRKLRAMKIGAIAGRARACANCTDAMLFNYWERQPETVLIPCTSMPCNARLWLHWCVKTRRCLASYVSCLTFTFLVFDEKYRNMWQFLARGVLVLIFCVIKYLSNRLTCRKFVYDQVCYHFRWKYEWNILPNRWFRLFD